MGKGGRGLYKVEELDPSLIPLISNSKLILQYAKNREAEKLYAEAASAYEKGRDHLNLVRMYVDHLNNIDGV
jgi:predicted RNA-binding protein